MLMHQQVGAKEAMKTCYKSEDQPSAAIYNPTIQNAVDPLESTKV